MHNSEYHSICFQVIMPLRHLNLLDLLKELEKKGPDKALYSFKNTYFMDSMLSKDQYSQNPSYDQSVPEYMHMLRHLVRSQKHTQHRVPKSIFKTHQYIKTVMAHHHSSCLKGHKCPREYVDQNLAHMTHYRDGCQRAQAKQFDSYKNKTIEDFGILRFKEELLERVNKTLTDIGWVTNLVAERGA